MIEALLLLASVTCTDLGGGFTQCYDTDPDDSPVPKYSTCYELDGTTVCEDQ